VKLIVAIDTTVLFAALLSNGVCRKLLEFGALGIYTPVITSEVLAELNTHCHLGIKGKPITDEIVNAFREAIAPLLEPENVVPSPFGRFDSAPKLLVNVENTMIFHRYPDPSASPRGEKRKPYVMGERKIVMTDMADAHVLAAAALKKADYLCTSNSKDLPSGLEFLSTKVITPSDLYRKLTDEE